MLCNWNDGNVKPFQSNNWRASLVPAAAVIPAPIVYIRVVAVKKLVVGFLLWSSGTARMGAHLVWLRLSSCSRPRLIACAALRNFYFEKNRVFQAGLSP